jgi:twitching motility protein PilT
MKIDELIQLTKNQGASDLILTAGVPPILRIDKKLVFTQLPALSPVQIDELLTPIMDEPKKEKFNKKLELSFIYSVTGWGRFRVNIFKQRGSTAATIRRFPYQLPSVEELYLPAATLRHFCCVRDGLVMVTGPAGGGKSTTLACLLRIINDSDSLHIITLEDPIEYLFKHNKSVVEQRSIPDDSPSFADSLKEILRQTPDVVVVGEIRDPETLRHTLRVAESGTLVLATFHTATASDTLNRIINFFPREEEQIRMQLSLILRGIFSQQLIPMYQKQGLVPAWEALIVNERVTPLIREGNIQQIDNVIVTSSKFGMQSMDQTLLSLYNRKLISREDLLLRLRHADAESLTSGKEDFLSEEDSRSESDVDTYNPNP